VKRSNRPALSFASQPCGWFAFFEDEDAAGPSSLTSGNCPSSERVSVQPEAGLAKIDHEEEKLSLGGIVAGSNRPSNEKSSSTTVDVKLPAPAPGKK
jgi:hypothetical protein